jgi:hypothetical protein
MLSLATGVIRLIDVFGHAPRAVELHRISAISRRGEWGREMQAEKWA